MAAAPQPRASCRACRWAGASWTITIKAPSPYGFEAYRISDNPEPGPLKGASQKGRMRPGRVRRDRSRTPRRNPTPAAAARFRGRLLPLLDSCHITVARPPVLLRDHNQRGISHEIDCCRNACARSSRKHHPTACGACVGRRWPQGSGPDRSILPGNRCPQARQRLALG